MNPSRALVIIIPYSFAGVITSFSDFKNTTSLCTAQSLAQIWRVVMKG